MISREATAALAQACMAIGAVPPNLPRGESAQHHVQIQAAQAALGDLASCLRYGDVPNLRAVFDFLRELEAASM